MTAVDRIPREPPADAGVDAVLTAEAVLDLSPVMPVVVIEDVESAVPLARALVAGGVRVIEITLRTRAALAAVERVAAEVPEIVVGAGTLTSAEQVTAVQRAGARFLVSPGSPSRLVDAALSTGLPLLAGVSTVTEMMVLADRGLTAMKFFPARASGGVAYLSAVAGPLPQLRFCPTGGITASSAPTYLALPTVGCVGGSWLTPRETVARGDWGRVSALAAEASCLARAAGR